MKRLLLAVIALLSIVGCTNSGTFDVSTSNVTIFGDDDTGGVKAFRVDNLTQALVSLPYSHFELHEGHVYSFCGVTNVTGSGNVTYLLITPGEPIHIQFSVQTEAEASFQLYENATATDNGTSQPAINRNRTSSNTSNPLAYLNPTLTSLGTTLLCSQRWGSGKGVGGGADIEESWILSPNTTYVIRITNETVTSQYASVELSWYVH